MSVIEKLDGVLAAVSPLSSKSTPTDVMRASAKALDLLRDHGPAIRQAMIDARRYRWLRKFSDNGGAVKPMVPTLAWAGPYTEGWHARLDSAIDAAIGARLASDSEGGE